MLDTYLTLNRTSYDIAIPLTSAIQYKIKRINLVYPKSGIGLACHLTFMFRMCIHIRKLQGFLLLLGLSHSIAISSQNGPGGVGSSATNVLWLMANSGVFSDAGITPAVNGSNVQQWNDLSGNAVPTSQTTASRRPNYTTNVVNALPVLRYTSANNDLLTAVGMSTANLASVWVVAAYSSLPNPNPGLIQASPSGLSASTNANDKAIGVWVNSGAGTQVWGRGIQSNNAQRNISQVTTLNANTFYSIGTIYRSTRIDQYVNSSAAGNNTAHDGTLKSWTDASIGMQGNESWNGDIAEVIFFNTELNEAQRRIVDNYLSAKYSLSLTANELYTMDTPGNGNFDYEVAGIGRVDASNLHNDAKGTGIVRILNPSNLGNDEFLIWGHNNGVQQATETADVPATVQARFNRVWRVSEVNSAGTAVDVGNVDVRFDLSGLGTVTASDLRLLVDTDNDGVFSDETPISGATSLGGNVYQFAGVSAITNARRFTLGTINTSQTPLPIEWLNFDAQANGRTIHLNWSTASEKNNLLFVVERSSNGLDWTKIGERKGSGNSSQACHYSYQDEVSSESLNYYRIKQVDTDGQYAYSRVIAVENKIEFHTELEIFPNPASDMLHVISSGKIIRLELFEPSGKSLGTLVIGPVIALPVLKNGLYILRVNFENGGQINKSLSIENHW